MLSKTFTSMAESAVVHAHIECFLSGRTCDTSCTPVHAVYQKKYTGVKNAVTTAKVFLQNAEC